MVNKAVYYSCLENPMDREVWWATVHEVERVRYNLEAQQQQQQQSWL